MPKKAKELSARAVSTIKEDGRYAVGGVDGLHLRVAGISRSWVLRLAVGARTTTAGKTVPHRRDIGLGSYPEVSLADAREKAREYRKQVRDGIDPLEARRAAKAKAHLDKAKSKTFKECAETYIAANRSGWKNPKHALQWESTLATYAYPIIGHLMAPDIDTGLVLSVLQQGAGENSTKTPLWLAKNETASRVRGRIESILDWATFRGLRKGENPARWKGHLEHELPAPNKVQKVKHHPALAYSEVGTFMAKLRKHQGISPRALEFAILTAARSNEVFGATWGEIDLNSKVWTIPSGRMKAEKEHRIPLSDDALVLLKAMPRLEGNDLIFPAPRGGKLSDMALTALIKRLHESEQRAGRKGFIDPRQDKVATTHGFRSTFRDWAGETTSHPREVIEHALAHKLADEVEAAYQRGDLLAKRSRLMTDWAQFCSLVGQ